MRRRDFITLLGGAAVACPLAARAQQSTPVIGLLLSTAPAIRPGFRQGLAELGYVDGQNVRIDIRFSGLEVDD
jgi:putative ABC transport system substrate-binding protein